MDGPKTEKVSPGIDQIPFEGIEEIGKCFAEGEKKYGRDNWKNQNNAEVYDQERSRHALRHLYLWINGDRSENHLAKVAWFCVTQIWREKNRPKPNPNVMIGSDVSLKVNNSNLGWKTTNP